MPQTATIMKPQLVKPSSQAEKKTRTVLDTVLVTTDLLNSWKTPGFQRPIRENEKVRALAEELKQNGGVFPGIMTLGVFAGEVFLIDGGHRKYAFLLSGIKEGYADVRTHYFTSMADMGDEFVQLNSQLVRMRPDDILRGLESSYPLLREIRQRCPFVGYDQVRRGTHSPIVSMCSLLRNWFSTEGEMPSLTGTVKGGSTGLVQSLTSDEVTALTGFLDIAFEAFGKDPEYAKLWGGLNMITTMWLYRNIVLSTYSAKSIRLTKDQFRKCLMSVSANAHYLDWLVGRITSERDRAPCYNKIKAILLKRIEQDTGHKVMLPAPAWSHNFHRREI
jgi:hypothetical protein